MSQLSSAISKSPDFAMSSGYNVEEKDAESVKKTLGSEKNGATLMLAASADGMILLLHISLMYNAMLRKQLPTR